MAFFICFTGIDGTGKTTLSKELVELLNEKGVNCKYVYARLNPIILKPFILIGEWIFLRGSEISENYSEYSNTKRKTMEIHSFLSRIYEQILLLDYMLQVFFKVKVPLIFGKNIVCDRYIYDTVITDLSVDMNYSEDKTIRLLDNIFRFFPEPDITFLVDVSEEIAYERKNDIPSILYLRERRDMYLNIGKKCEMVILDGSKKREELQCEIEKKVFQWLQP
jgi:dTMP kinase